MKKEGQPRLSYLFAKQIKKKKKILGPMHMHFE